MTNEEMFEDLKQFIDTRFSEQNDEWDRKFDEKFDAKFEEKFAPINKKIDELTEFVTDAIDANNDETDKQLADHDHRLSTLERKIA